MMKGVLFGDKHSYRDWGLVLASRPKISPPTPKTVYIDIPSANGKIDLTESLTGDVSYDNRIIFLEFSIVQDRSEWSRMYSEILDYMQGKKIEIVLDEDSYFYYIGRVTVGEWEAEKASSLLTIEVDAEPFKLEKIGSLEDWEWDDFDFEIGIIREYKDIRVEGSREFIIEGRRKPVIPTFIAAPDSGSTLSVAYNNIEYVLPTGTSRILNIVIASGTHTLKFYGFGTISIDYRGGGL